MSDVQEKIFSYVISEKVFLINVLFVQQEKFAYKLYTSNLLSVLFNLAIIK